MARGGSLNMQTARSGTNGETNKSLPKEDVEKAMKYARLGLLSQHSRRFYASEVDFDEGSESSSSGDDGSSSSIESSSSGGSSECGGRRRRSYVTAATSRRASVDTSAASSPPSAPSAFVSVAKKSPPSLSAASDVPSDVRLSSNNRPASSFDAEEEEEGCPNTGVGNFAAVKAGKVESSSAGTAPGSSNNNRLSNSRVGDEPEISSAGKDVSKDATAVFAQRANGKEAGQILPDGRNSGSSSIHKSSTSRRNSTHIIQSNMKRQSLSDAEIRSATRGIMSKKSVLLYGREQEEMLDEFEDYDVSDDDDDNYGGYDETKYKKDIGGLYEGVDESRKSYGESRVGSSKLGELTRRALNADAEARGRISTMMYTSDKSLDTSDGSLVDYASPSPPLPMTTLTTIKSGEVDHHNNTPLPKSVPDKRQVDILTEGQHYLSISMLIYIYSHLRETCRMGHTRVTFEEVDVNSFQSMYGRVSPEEEGGMEGELLQKEQQSRKASRRRRTTASSSGEDEQQQNGRGRRRRRTTASSMGSSKAGRDKKKRYLDKTKTSGGIIRIIIDELGDEDGVDGDDEAHNDQVLIGGGSRANREYEER